MSETLYEQLKALVGKEGPRLDGLDEVCQPMIRHWCEAMQDANPVYTDKEYAARSKYGSTIAPPTMLLSWSMSPLWPPQPVLSAGSLDRAIELLDAAGFNQVIIASTNQKYHKPLLPGDRVSFTFRIDDVSPERDTNLGRGYFVTTTFTYRNQKEELVGTQTLNMLRYHAKS